MNYKLMALLLGLLTVTAGCINLTDNSEENFGEAEIDGQTMVTDSVVLSEVDSFAYNSTFVAEEGNETQELLVSGALVVGENRGVRSQTGSLGNTSRYTDGNVTFAQGERAGGEVVYTRYEAPYDGIGSPVQLSTFAGENGNTSSTYAAVVENLTLERVGYEDYHGDRVAVYEHVATENVTGSDFGFTFNQSAVDVEERRLVFRMTEDGQFVSHEYEFTGTVTETGDEFVVRQRGDVHGINSTTVEEPDWVETARNETSA